MRLVLIILLNFVLSGLAAAQEQPAAAPPAAAAPADAAAAEAPPAEGAEAGAPALPAAVTDPSTSMEILQIRLVPLTKDELAQAAARWLEIVKAKTSEVADATVAISQAGSNATAAQRERLAALIAERKSLFDNYARVILSLIHI